MCTQYGLNSPDRGAKATFKVKNFDNVLKSITPTQWKGLSPSLWMYQTYYNVQFKQSAPKILIIHF